MSKLNQVLTKLKERVVEAAEEAWITEPARVLSIATTAVVGVLAGLHVAIPSSTVSTILAFAVPLVLGELIRTQVRPAAHRRVAARRRR